ncbi:hypothetical protein KFE25_011314 [Diacronema lutheri]|uniref:Uncharacterized protein n=1 Tax=Diacronema lutheri TaxID=2081491 RepID=A0A8J5WZH6_DIALT|nr:hypothetical protein KFE25_011314 [Diacronema lutheri]
MATAEPMAQPLPVGNYKGVMLCNRPDDGATAPGGARASRGAGVRPSDADGPVFLPPGFQADRLGLNPARDNTVTNVVARAAELAEMRHERRHKERNGNYMYRHRKWLAQLGDSKRTAADTAAADGARASELRAKLAASAVAFRNRLRRRREAAAAADANGAAAGQRASGAPAGGAPAGGAGAAADADAARPPTLQPRPALAPAAAPARADGGVPTPAPPAPAVPAAPAVPGSRGGGGGNGGGYGGGQGRPKWAMTEERAVAEEAAEEEDEVASLLNFAQALNFEKYVDDFEVRSALEAIKASLDKAAVVDGGARSDSSRRARARALSANGADEARADFAADFAAEWNEGGEEEGGDSDDDDGGGEGGAGARERGGGGGGGGGGSRGLNWDGLSRAGDSNADQPALLAGLRRLRAARAARSARGDGSDAGGSCGGGGGGDGGGGADGALLGAGGGQSQPAWDSTSSAGGGGGGVAGALARAEARAAREAARELLALNKALGAKHSTASLAATLESVTRKADSERADTGGGAADWTEAGGVGVAAAQAAHAAAARAAAAAALGNSAPLPSLKIAVTHRREQSAADQNSRFDASNLPYLHRNPAV